MAFLDHKDTNSSAYQRDKERISKRFQTNFEAIIAKYNRPFGDTDVLDLDNMTVVEDRGFLSSTRKLRIGTTKLAVDKVSPRKATRWDSTKDSTDSAFGSTRFSESEDTSGTETIANYSHQNARFVNAEGREKDVPRLDDGLMTDNSHSEDSGNEDVESDHSGPICTPKKSSHAPSLHHRGTRDTSSNPVANSVQRVRGNLSKRFEGEHRMKAEKQREMLRELSDIDDVEEIEEDPYEFKDELPSILEEKNRFLCKMQSILVDTFSDYDGVDAMDSPSDGEGSTGTMESSEATSGSISAWSTLPSKPTPKRTSTFARLCQSGDLNSRKNEIPLKGNNERHLHVEGHMMSGADTDYTECSTILAGNLHVDRVLFRPSNLLPRAHQNQDLTRGNNPSHPPFEAICNSTMLSEINPPAFVMAESKPQPDSEQHRGLELPLDGQGEMCLGEVPHNVLLDFKPELEGRSDSLYNDASNTPKSKGSSEFRTPVKSDFPNRRTESAVIQVKSHTPAMRNHNQQDFTMSPSGCDVSRVTPRARLQKAAKHYRRTTASFPSPRFDTQEIIEIFRSPKPLIIPGIDLDSLDLTPRRRVKRECAATPTGPLKNVLLRLHSPSTPTEGRTNCRSQTDKQIKPKYSDIMCEAPLDRRSCKSKINLDQRSEALVCKSKVHLEDRPRQVTRTPGDTATVNDCKHQRRAVEAANAAPPEVHRSKTHLKEDPRNVKASHPVTKGNKSEASRIHPSTRATHAVDNQPQNTTTEKTEKPRKHSKVRRNDIGAAESQDGQTASHPRSPSSQELNAGLKSGTPRSQHPRLKQAPKSVKVEAERKLNDHGRPVSRQSRELSVNNTKEKSVQQSRLPGNTSDRDIKDRSKHNQHKSPVSSKAQRAKGCILTPTVQRSPSTLTSPLNCMSIRSPKADKLSKGSDKKRSVYQIARNKIKKVSDMQPRSRHVEDNVRLKDRGRETKEFNNTHLTIRDFDDDSEEEMEVNTDPYSLTADDSSPGQSPYHRRRILHAKVKSTAAYPSDQSKHKDNRLSSRESDKLRSSQLKADHLSQRFQEHNQEINRDCTKQNRHSERSDGFQRRHSENHRDLGESNPSFRRKEHMSMTKTPALNRAALHHEQRIQASHSPSTVVARMEHTQYFSDDECNSSGDSAKFLTLAPNERLGDVQHTDPGTVQDAVPMHKRTNHVEVHSRISRVKHQTTIKCGQIISSPKSAKSLSRNLPKTCSPLRAGRVEKSRKMYSNSPTRSFQSDGKSARSSSKVVKTGQYIKTVSRRLIGSPLRNRDDDDVGTVSDRAVVSSPLRSSGCNVSSSYTCEGPGRCTKPFCFSCAVGELS